MRSTANVNLTTGLTTIAVQMVPQTKTDDIAFNLVSPDGKPVKQVYRTDDGSFEGTIASCERAYEGTIIPKDDLKAIEDATKLRDLDIQEFVSVKDVPFERATGTWYVQANPKAGLASLRVLTALVKAMAKKKVAAVTKWTPRKRQTLLVLHVQDGLLMATALAFTADIQQPDEAVEAVKTYRVENRDVAIAEQLIDMAQGDGRVLNEAKDEAVEQRKNLVAQYVNTGATPQPVKPQPKPEAKDAMDTLLADIERLKQEKAQKAAA